MWRYYFDGNKDNIQARSEEGTEVYTRMDRRSRRYSLSHTEEGTAIPVHPATIVELEGGALQMQGASNDQAIETDTEHETFTALLKNCREEWFWEDIQTLDDT